MWYILIGDLTVPNEISLEIAQLGLDLILNQENFENMTQEDWEELLKLAGYWESKHILDYVISRWTHLQTQLTTYFDCFRKAEPFQFSHVTNDTLTSAINVSRENQYETIVCFFFTIVQLCVDQTFTSKQLYYIK